VVLPDAVLLSRIFAAPGGHGDPLQEPLFVLVRGYRAVLLEGHAPALAPLWKLWLLSVAVFLLGHAWFYKLRKTFADVI